MFEDRIAQSLEDLELAEPVRHSGLTVFPLIGRDKPGPQYLTLDEALHAGAIEISEVSEGGRVPELLLANEADLPVLLVDGEELVGAKQNRVLNLTILVRPKSKVTIPVSCVERGRWSYRKRNFATSDRSMFAQAKASKLRQVSANMRAKRGKFSDQGQVWADIDAKLASMNTAAPSSAMSDVFERYQAGVDDYVEQLQPQANQRGAVYVMNGTVVGVELFDKAATFAKLAPKLTRSYALDAIEVGPRETKAAPMIVSLAFERLKKLKVEAYPGTDLGTDLRMADAELSAAALEFESAILHLEAFAAS